MAYIANQTRVASLTIAGTDYTAALVSWEASDETAFKNGCLVTTGSIVLGQVPGSFSVADYDRNDFKRGAPVVLDLTEPGGATYRHPRGYLYVVSMVYDVENEQLLIETGCRLALMALTEEIDDLLPLAPIFLDTAQETFQNISAAFASVGQYVYQDNQGALQTGTFFAGDSTSGVAAGEWVSVLGTTTLSAEPLAGTGAIPDQISLSYQVPSDGLATDRSGHVETVVDESRYFVQYPVAAYVRINSDADSTNPNGTLGNVTNTQTSVPSTGSASACGNTPVQPGDNGTPSCNDGYELSQQPIYLPATRTTTTETYYDGPGAQVSRSYQEVRGPALEANQQYYADKYTYCRYTWATACQPNGGCETEGMDQILLAYTETINYYGDANELVMVVVDTYQTTLSAAQPSDWRSGVVNGVPQDFDQNLSLTDMYRVSRQVTRYFQKDSANVQKVATWQSVTSRGVGISSGNSIDALNGIKTSNTRTSTTTATLDVAPDRLNTATTSTEEQVISLPLFTGRFQEPPNGAGPYIMEEQIPMPLLFDNQAEIDSAVNAYSNYIERFVKGDAFGLQIAESMRSDVYTNWRPGMPFRYADTARNKLLAMRMDATTWGVSPTESAFATNGIWIGESNGTVTLPENLVGNSRPDMGGGGAPPGAIIPPSVGGETGVDSGTFAWIVDVHIMTQLITPEYGNDNVVPSLPTDTTYNAYRTTTCYVAGLVVQAGDVLATSTNGSIPLDYKGSLLTDTATIVTADLFA